MSQKNLTPKMVDRCERYARRYLKREVSVSSAIEATLTNVLPGSLSIHWPLVRELLSARLTK